MPNSFSHSSPSLFAVFAAVLVSCPALAQEDQNADQIIIKEVYCGGCPQDEGSSFFQQDKAIVLYNNCPERIVASNLCFGMATPYNAEAPSIGNIYGNDGQLTYNDDGFIPAQNGIWFFTSAIVIEPFQQVVVNVHGAIDNTQTYSQSVNYAHSSYYCMYDPESGYVNTTFYPTPADVIPASHYLSCAKYGQGNAWPMSVTAPAVYIFQTQGISPRDFAMNADNMWYAPGAAQSSANACVKVPSEWIIDGVEVFNAAKKEACMKRLTADIDAGYVYLTNKLGHSLYRNVDKEATEALKENNGKLVYGYALGCDGSTDPSGIDAEESRRNGAHIVYQDYNDSGSDFHERKRTSLRDYEPDESAEGVKGDVNGDGAVNVADISAIISVMAGEKEGDRADVNSDGAVNVADISAVISIMAGN